MRFETWYKTDLQRPPQVQTIMGNTFTQDNLGNLMGVRVMKGNAEATLTGTVLGYVIRGDGKTVVINGTVDGNRAYIILPEAAYAVPGMITVTLRLVDGSAKTVLAAWAVNVQRSASGDIIDPGHVVPSLDELLAQIDAMEQGTAAANQAASAANTAAANADAKAALADQKAALANTAATNANDKATLADQKATLANTAATNANDKAALADQKATLANTAATNANDKATLADQKATLANTAAEAADLAADAATDAAAAANDAADQVAEVLQTGVLVDEDGLFYVITKED